MNAAAQCLTAASGFVLVVAGVAAFFKWIRPAWKHAKADVVSGRDALLGRDEIRDSITGRVIAPALPGMGVRMDRNEEQMGAMVEAVAQIAPVLTQLAETHKWQDVAEKRFADHEKQIVDNAKNIADLKAAYMERIANHIESAAAFNAMGQIARDPDKTND